MKHNHSWFHDHNHGHKKRKDYCGRGKGCKFGPRGHYLDSEYFPGCLPFVLIIVGLLLMISAVF